MFLFLRNKNRLFRISKQILNINYRSQFVNQQNHVRYMSKTKYQITVELPDTAEVETKLNRIDRVKKENSQSKLSDIGLGTLGGLTTIGITTLALGLPLATGSIPLIIMNPTIMLNGVFGFAGTYCVSSITNKFRLRNKTIESEELKYELIEIAKNHHKKKLPRNHYLNEVPLLKDK